MTDSTWQRKDGLLLLAEIGGSHGGHSGYAKRLAKLAISAAVALLLFLAGIVWFRRLERTFADTMG